MLELPWDHSEPYTSLYVSVLRLFSQFCILVGLDLFLSVSASIYLVSGGGRVARIVAEAAAKHLTPMTLEVCSSLLLGLAVWSLTHVLLGRSLEVFGILFDTRAYLVGLRNMHRKESCCNRPKRRPQARGKTRPLGPLPQRRPGLLVPRVCSRTRERARYADRTHQRSVCPPLPSTHIMRALTGAQIPLILP